MNQEKEISWEEERIRLKEIAEQDSEKWILPYGNLMTICMIFFLILYAFTFWGSDVNYEKIVTKIQEDLTDKKDEEFFKKITKQKQEIIFAEKIEKFMSQQGMEKISQIQVSAERIKLLFNAPMLFELGKADLTVQTKQILDAVSDFLKMLPNKIIVEGHTDNLPIKSAKYDSNWELSVARSLSVINYFIQKGVSPVRFSAAGYGEFKPVVPNTSEENRAKNRRIEIIIIREKEI